jgi:hypothetical protein
VKPKASIAAEKNVKRQSQDSWLSDFDWIMYENGLMTCKFCKTFPSMVENSDLIKGFQERNPQNPQ